MFPSHDTLEGEVTSSVSTGVKTGLSGSNSPISPPSTKSSTYTLKITESGGQKRVRTCSVTIEPNATGGGGGGGGCTGSDCCTGTGCGTFNNCQTLGTCPPQTICEDGSYAPFGEPCTVQKQLCSLLTHGISIGSGAQRRTAVEIKRGQSIALKWRLPASRWSSGNGPVSFQIGREDGDYPIDKTGEPNATLGPTINAASPERNLNTVASNGSLLLKGDGVFSLTVAPEKTTTYRVHQQGYAQQQALAFRDYIRNPENVNTLRAKIGAVRSELQNIKNARANFTRGNQGAIQAYPFWTSQYWLVLKGQSNAQNPRSIASDVDKMTNMLTALPYSNFSDSEKWPMPTLAQTETPANNHKYFHNSYPSGYAGTMTLVQFL